MKTSMMLKTLKKASLLGKKKSTKKQKRAKEGKSHRRVTRFLKKILSLKSYQTLKKKSRGPNQFKFERPKNSTKNPLKKFLKKLL